MAVRSIFRDRISQALNLLMVGALAFIGWPVLKTTSASAQLEGTIRTTGHEAHAAYDAFERFYSSNGSYPGTYAGWTFDLETLDPLRKRGYYDGALTALLRNQRVDAYDSPDDQGLNQEFWVEMTLEADPSIRILLARSDDAPMSAGHWVEGVFIYRNGELEQL